MTITAPVATEPIARPANGTHIFAVVNDTVGPYGALPSQVDYPALLISFYRFPDYWEHVITHTPRLALTDSGAFTVWTKGESIDLSEYIRWCHGWYRKQRPPTVHINLDVMPGERGRKPTRREQQAGIRQSLKNADRMRAEGLAIMEVHHQGEPWEFLTELLDRRAPGDLLGISPRQGTGPVQRRKYADAVFARIMERYGQHIPPCHGLGVSNYEQIGRYPWYSVDSIAWVIPGKYGTVITRDRRNTKAAHTRSQGRYAECARYLYAWKRWALELSRLWERRGVTWQM